MFLRSNGEGTSGAPAPTKPARRFDTPGRKWLERLKEFEEDHGPQEERIMGEPRCCADAASGPVARLSAYVHPRTLKGHVNVDALGVDDPCGDDVA